MRRVCQGWVSHVPVFRVVHLLPIFQAADERQEATVVLTLKQDPAPLRQKVVQRPVRNIAVRSEHSDAGLGHLAQAGDKNLVVVIIFIGMDFVEDHLAGAHTVPALRIVGAALHHTLVLQALHHLLGVVVVLAEFRLPPGGLQHVREIFHRRHRLLLVVGAHVHVVALHGVIGRQRTRSVKRDKAVFARAAAHHAQQLLPPGLAVRPVRAVPQRQQKFLPGEKSLVREIPQQAQIPAQLLRVHADVLLGKHAADQRRQRVLLRAGARRVRLHQLDIPQHLRRNVTAHRHRPAGRKPARLP